MAPLTDEKIKRDAAGNTIVGNVGGRNVITGAQKAPINRTVQTQSDAEQHLGEFRQPESVSDIANRKRSESQGLIDSVKDLYASEFDQVEQRRGESLSQRNAVSVMTGQAGSGRAGASQAGVNKEFDKEREALAVQKVAQLEGIYTQISQDAQEEARLQLQDATAQAEGIMARDEEKQARAVESFSLMAQSGTVDFDSFRDNPENQEVYNYALRTVGGSEDALKGLFALNRPQDEIIESRWQGNQLFQAYQNPVTGEIRTEMVDFGELGLEIPRGYSKSVDLGGQIMLVPEDFDPSKDTPFYVSKSLTPNQAQIGSGTGGGVGSVEPSGEVMRDADSIMAGVLNLNDTSTKDNYRGELAGELLKRVDEAKASGDMYGVMAASAAYDKEVSDTFIQTMNKTISVMEQLGVLQQNITGTDTGPLVGLFREKNPWDTNAQTIKAQLNAIVPNLARGVYGEVGVLTDTDIKTYSKTIPNLTSTEDVRNAVLYITVDMIRRNIESKIEGQVAGQRDMSGYSGIYADVVALADNVLSTLPQSAAPGGGSGDDETQAAQSAEIGSMVTLNGGSCQGRCRFF